MLHSLFVSVIAAPHTPAIDLATITPARARVTVGAPPFSVVGPTLLGPGGVDDVERLAVAPGTAAFDEGDRATVTGTLTVTGVPARRIGAVPVPAYTEVRVTKP